MWARLSPHLPVPQVVDPAVEVDGLADGAHHGGVDVTHEAGKGVPAWDLFHIVIFFS